ncbi:MAG: formylglycine-generating enzyme family protein [Candidatus Competibacter sp.]|nr:formylglycine-generating enzyme family protein [Candidatus Competibacter sp.]
MFRKWGWLALWMVLGLTGGAVGGAEPNPEEVRKLMEKYERRAAPPAPKPAPAPKPKPKPKPPPVEVESAPVAGGPDMVKISGGCFQMGSPENEPDRGVDERQHQVCVRAFEIGRYEVTVGEFTRFVNATGHRTDAERNAGGKEGCYAWSATTGQWDLRAGTDWRNPGFPQRDNYPVVCVSWNDAVAYTAWLSRETGQRYRLPTEAEWEYAARAGTTTARYWGDDPDQACAYANVADQTKAPEGNSWTQKHECNDGYWYPAPVGRFRANDWRLNDMLGNVWEWTCSAYDKEYGGAELKCTSKDTTGARAVRGGSWNFKPARVRSANRSWGDPTYRNYFTGFRLARSL